MVHRVKIDNHESEVTLQLGTEMYHQRLFNRTLLIAATCLVLFTNSVVLFSSLNSLIDTTNRVRHTIDVKGELARLVVEMSNAVSGQRGYLLTSDIRYLEPYYSASNSIHNRLEMLRNLVADNRAQVQLVEKMQEIVTRRFAGMAETVLMHDRGNSSAAADQIRLNRDGGVALEFHRIVDSMHRAEEDLLAERQIDADFAKRAAFVTFGAFVATTLLLLAALFYLGRREITRRAQALKEHEMLAANLQEHSKHLTQERNDVAQLNEVSNFLQSCDSMEEISALMTPFLTQLFPQSSGAIHITAASRNRLDIVSAWGAKSFPRQFAPQECWGLRRGQIHVRSEQDVTPCCEHLVEEHGHGDTICIPLVAQGETLGLLSLSNGPSFAVQKRDHSDTRRLAEMLARQIGLTLSNIRLRESLQDQSIRDPMTRAFNRRHLETVIEKELAKAVRYGRQLSIAMIDIDHFKRYNDTHGHQAGDAALIAVAQHMQSALRDSDWLFRYGGEEFLILFTEAALEDAEMQLDKIREAVSGLSIALDGLALPHVTISCGAAALNDEVQTFEYLLSAADRALYEAKASGRNRVVCARDVAPISLSA